MYCPHCRHLESKVVDSRESQDGASIRRRRACLKCGRRFTTYERVEEEFPAVIKKDGRREVFDRNKLAEGIRKACEKRPISVEAIAELVDRVVRLVQETGSREVESALIGRKVMEELHRLDPVAYVRFASVYRSFKDINEFMTELKDLLSRKD